MKDIKSLSDQVRHIAYLKSSRLEHGLLINFGSYKFEIRKFAWTEGQPQRAQRFSAFLISALFAFFAVKLASTERLEAGFTANGRRNASRERTMSDKFQGFVAEQRNIW